MDKEIWKAVPNYEGVYEASTHGRIRSLDRKVPHGVGGGYRNRKGTILKTDKKINGAGYMYATLANSGIHKKLAVHQIVAMSFLNHTPSGYELVINHIDGDRLNNHKDNLEIVTTRQNATVKFKDRDKVLTSSYVGVCFDKFKKRWLAAITVGGKQIHLGYHKVEIDAHNAYQKALKAVVNGSFKEDDFKAKFSNKYKGVYFNKQSGKYSAILVYDKNRYNLGTYSDELDAHNAYLLAKEQIANGTFLQLREQNNKNK